MRKFFWSLLLLLPSLYWFWCAAPWFGHIYDIDPSDGDILHAAFRIKEFLPLYGDWAKGEIYGNYGPIYYSWVALSSLFFSLPSLIVFLRVANGVFVFLAFLVSLRTMDALAKGQRAAWFPKFLFSLCFWVLMGENTIGALTLQTNAMFLFFQAIAFYWAAAHGGRWRFAILLMVLLPLVKQSGVAAAGALLLCVYYQVPLERRRFILWSVLLGLAALGLLESWNNGNFLRAAFLYPREVFSSEGAWVAEYPKEMLKEFFRGQFWLYYFLNSVLFVFSFFFKRFRILSVFVLAELLIFHKIGHNIGGSITYLWFYGLLLCLFVGQFFDFAYSSLRLPLSKILIRRSLIPAAALGFLFLCIGAVSLMSSSRQGRSSSTKQVREIQDLSMDNGLREFLKQHSAARWFSMRYSMPLLNAGIRLDVESCTLQFALEAQNVVNKDLFLRRFSEGHYEYVWSSDLLAMPDVQGVVEKCFTPVRSFPWADRVRARTFTVYQYSGCS